MTPVLATAGYLDTPAGKLHYLLWRPEAPRARVVLLHGLESHGGWFTDFGSHLAATGHVVVALDRAGAGRSEGPRGDMSTATGLFAQVRTLLREVAPSLPSVVLGFSWGARWALAQAVQEPADTQGLILMAPGLRLQAPYPPLTRALVFATALCRPGTRVRTPVPDDRWFTTRSGPLAFIRSDPWRLSQVTSRLLWQSWILERLFVQRAQALRVPILHLVAGRDRICDNDRNREQLRAAVPDGLYAERFYADAEHALMFECDRYPIISDIATWIGSSFPGVQKPC
jgi:acylglycerol lipase